MFMCTYETVTFYTIEILIFVGPLRRGRLKIMCLRLLCIDCGGTSETYSINLLSD